jgi:hypothetical protein
MYRFKFEIITFLLQGQLYSDSEPIEARAEAVVLLKQLNFPVGILFFYPSLNQKSL